MANLNVTVQDGNNINVEVTPTPRQTIVLDRGVAGVGIESVTIVYQDPIYYLEFTYTNGTTELVALPAIATGVVSFNTRIGIVTLTSLDVTDALGYTPPEPDGTGATGTWAISVTGNAATATNGVVTTGSYSDPAWITALGGAKIVGNITGNAANVTGVIAIANGGTGATNATAARSNLGLGSAAVLTAGAALGVATLDAGGTVPISQIPSSIIGGVSYQGTWNAATNTPTLTSSTGVKGYYYIVSVAGTTNLDGITDWLVGDWAIFNGTTWNKIDNTETVTSVNGYIGAVVLAAADVGAPTTTGTGASGTWGISVSGNAATATNVAYSGLTGTVPTWNQNTTGNAATVTNGVYTTDTGTVTNTMLAGSIANDKLVNSAITINGTSTSLGGSVNVGTVTSVSGTAPIASTGGTTPDISISQSSASTDGYLSFTDWNTFNSKTSNTGTVTSVAATAGTGISVSGSPITTSGTLTITNTAPDQVVSLTGAGTTAVTGTYPNFTITSDDQFDGTVTSVAASAGTGISVSGSPITSSGTITITNTAPDQVVSLTGAGTTAVTGTYPNFTITSDDQFDGTVTSVSGTGSVNGITLTGTVTESGNLTLGGTLSNVSLTTQVTGTLPIANGGTNATTAADARTSLGLGTSAVLNAAVALGTATLDAGGTVPLSQIPASIQGGLIYQGTWNASTNTPTLTSSVGTKGHYYAVSVAGSTDLNGITDWNIGDLAVYNGTAWEQIDNTDAVTSVNGYTGSVVLTTTDVAEGTNQYFTQSRARQSISAGTGISYDNTSGIVTNAAPDQTVSLTGTGTTSISGTYPNFTINSEDQFDGTVTSVAASAGTGISVSGSPITSSGTITITNTAPDQVVSLTGAGTAVVTGTYPNFTVTANDEFDGTVTSVAATAGTGISVTGSPITSSGTLTITNTAPDQVVSLTGAGTTSITGTYPNFTVTSNDAFTGNVTGAASSTDNAVVRFDGTTGKVIQNSSVIIDDSNNVSGVATLNAANLIIADNATLGSSNTDNVAVNGRITTDLEPNTTGSHDIGTNGRNWRDGFFSRNLAAATLNATDVNANSAIISANSSTNALRITQVGSGNALLVEDSANPDSTPTVIDSSGRAIFGSTTFAQVNTYSNLEPLSVFGINGVGIQLGDFGANQFASGINFAKSRSGTVGTGVIVNNGDDLGSVIFNGYDGAAYKQAAFIKAAVDGTPGTNDMPGRLVFSTTADGASSPTERMRIDNAGRVGIGATPGATSRILFGGTSTGNSTQYGFLNQLTAASDVTSTFTGFTTSLSTAAASFTLSDLRHYNAGFLTIGAGSAITSQYGFYASNALTGATNNFGFYSNIASGTGRWNFYAAGSAANYFAGNVAIGTTVPKQPLTILNGNTWFFAAGPTDQKNTDTNVDGTNFDIRFLNDDYNAANTAYRITRSGYQTTNHIWYTGASTARFRIKSTGQIRFIPLASDPADADAGDVYYNSSDNKLKVYNGTSWIDLH